MLTLDSKPVFTVHLASKVGSGVSAVVDAKHALEQKLKRRGIDVIDGSITVNDGRVKAVDVIVRMYDSSATRATVMDLAKQCGLGVISIESDLKS